MTRKQIEQAADNAGWNCNIKKTKEGYDIRFYTDSPCGQDVNFEISVRTLDKVTNEVYEYWQAYDPEDEAVLWFGQNRGEPKSLRKLLDDMDWVDNMLESLYNHIYKIQ